MKEKWDMPRRSLRVGLLSSLLLLLLSIGLPNPVRGEKPTTAPAIARVPATAPTTQPRFIMGTPTDLPQLRSMETQVEQVVKRVMPAVVGIVNGSAQGSGV